MVGVLEAVSFSLSYLPLGPLLLQLLLLLIFLLDPGLDLGQRLPREGPEKRAIFFGLESDKKLLRNADSAQSK